MLQTCPVSSLASTPDPIKEALMGMVEIFA